MTSLSAPPNAATAPATGPCRWNWTRDELTRLDELGFFKGQRVMLIDGEVIAMSPMNESHARGIVFSLQALEAAFGPAVTYRSQMPMDLGQQTDPEPDIAVIDGLPRGQPATPPTTAVLVVEVANHSLLYDLGEKSSLYAAAGIADYWVFDVANSRLHVHRDPHPDSSQRFGFRYTVQRILRPTDRVSPLAAPNSSILVSDLLP